MQATVNVVDTWAGLLLHYQDDNNYYSVEVYDSDVQGDYKLRLVKFVNGFRSIPQDVDIADNNDKVLKVKIAGNGLTA
jgi:hypothetical protein